VHNYIDPPNPFIFLGYPTVGDEDSIFCLDCSTYTYAKWWELDSSLVMCPKCEKTYAAEELLG
jgi:hypothetical protein